MLVRRCALARLLGRGGKGSGEGSIRAGGIEPAGHTRDVHRRILVPVVETRDNVGTAVEGGAPRASHRQAADVCHGAAARGPGGDGAGDTDIGSAAQRNAPAGEGAAVFLKVGDTAAKGASRVAGAEIDVQGGGGGEVPILAFCPPTCPCVTYLPTAPPLYVAEPVRVSKPVKALPDSAPPSAMYLKLYVSPLMLSGMEDQIPK